MYIFKAGIRAETLLGGEEKSSEEIQVPWMSWKDLFEILSAVPLPRCRGWSLEGGGVVELFIGPIVELGLKKPSQAGKRQRGVVQVHCRRRRRVEWQRLCAAAAKNFSTQMSGAREAREGAICSISPVAALH